MKILSSARKSSCIIVSAGIGATLMLLGASIHLLVSLWDGQHKLIQEERQEIGRLHKELAEVKLNASKTSAGVAVQFEEEAKKREDAKVERETTEKETAQKLSLLEADILKAKKNELTSVIKKWRTRMAHIECAWIYTNNTRLAKGGSGFLFKATQLLTNKHVMTDERGELPSYCEISFADDSKKVVLEFRPSSDVFISPERDFVSIRITAPTEYMKKEAATSSPLCKKGVIGDQMVILGYPAIGAKQDVTATEGIISAYEDPYYITSAKLERGNSGGAAVLVKGDCYLGIPTFVRVGNVESLGRVLDIRKVEIP